MIGKEGRRREEKDGEGKKEEMDEKGKRREGREGGVRQLAGYSGGWSFGPSLRNYQAQFGKKVPEHSLMAK